jgi:hypothetical protein
MASCRRNISDEGRLMKIFNIAVALAAIVSVNAAQADDLTTWRASAAGKCLMDRGDSNVAKFAATDANCGPVGDSTRAARAFVLANDFETVIHAIGLGDPQGVKTMMTALWRTQNRSPALGSCWKTMVKVCNADEIGKTIEAAKPAAP